MIKIRTVLVILMTIGLFGCSSGPKLETSEKYGEEIYLYEEIEFPSALGTPKHNIKNLEKSADRSLSEMKDSIDNYADALMFLKNKTYGNEQKRFVSDLIFLLEGDYEEIEPVYIYLRNSEYHVLSIKANDKYYLLDPFSTYTGDKEWLQNYKTEKGSFVDKDSLALAVNYGFPKGEANYATYKLKDPEGKDLIYSYKDEKLLYKYQNINYLYDYGVPQLTGQEIEELVNKMNEGDYETVRNSVNTIPDFINLFITSGFKPNEGIVSTGQYTGPNVGHIYYGDEGYTIEGGTIEYSISGVESMILKEGQCDSTATLFHYFFNDKFDETGYVLIQNFNASKVFGYSCHAINYFKKNDKYYLFSPSYALTGDGAWGEYKDLWVGRDTIEELAQSLYDTEYPNGKVAALLLFEYDGLLAEGRTWNSKTDPSKNNITLPEGSDVKVRYAINYNFVKPMHSTSQDHIIGVQTK